MYELRPKYELWAISRQKFRLQKFYGLQSPFLEKIKKIIFRSWWIFPLVITLNAIKIMNWKFRLRKFEIRWYADIILLLDICFNNHIKCYKNHELEISFKKV
jgi:hypothetical protein